jgi:hypothetical protein
MMTLEDGRIRTWRFPLRSALTMQRRQLFRADINTTARGQGARQLRGSAQLARNAGAASPRATKRAG